MPRKRVVSRKMLVTVCDALVVNTVDETTFHTDVVLGGVVAPKAADARVQKRLDAQGEGVFKLVKVLKIWQETRMYVMDEDEYLAAATCEWIDSPCEPDKVG